MKKLNFIAAIVLATTSFAAAANPIPSTFASFSDSDTNKSFVFTNNGVNSTFIANSHAVSFSFLINGLSNSLSGKQEAHMTLTSSVGKTAVGFRTDGQFDLPADHSNQNLGTTTLKFTRDTEYNGMTNLLTVILSGANLSGENDTGGSNLTASSKNQNITFTSDFLDFSHAGTDSKDIALAFTGMSNLVGITANYFNTFSGTGTGSFSALPVPTSTEVPEPANLALLGLGLAGLIALRRRNAA